MITKTVAELEQLKGVGDNRAIYVNGKYRTIDVIKNRYISTKKFTVLTQNEYSIFLTTN